MLVQTESSDPQAEFVVTQPSHSLPLSDEESSLSLETKYGSSLSSLVLLLSSLVLLEVISSLSLVTKYVSSLSGLVVLEVMVITTADKNEIRESIETQMWIAAPPYAVAPKRPCQRALVISGTTTVQAKFRGKIQAAQRQKKKKH